MESSVLSTPVRVTSMTMPMVGSSMLRTMNEMERAMTKVAETPGSRPTKTAMKTAKTESRPIGAVAEVTQAFR